ncbi:hypothetical protein Cco03nite_57520 [Catellatospora coxensis]|uniref:Uncharacterized protein n=1 Tax=Catellatospora coxensis TaxID=310354 RepID=A0A8J3KZ92_9ACTN|nr:hypothetical protein Cco03nite_57520 [Catellatospora coxensis]
MPGSGPPIGTLASGSMSGSQRPSVEFTVASVGPYALNICRPRAKRATSAVEIRSVPASSVAPSGRSQSSGRAASSAGGRIMKVMPWARAYSVSSGPGTRRSAGTTTSRAPVSSPRHRSKNATSKLGDANCSTRPSGPTPSRSVAVASSFTTPACDTTTPLGRPVEPEV